MLLYPGCSAQSVGGDPAKSFPRLINVDPRCQQTGTKSNGPLMQHDWISLRHLWSIKSRPSQPSLLQYPVGFRFRKPQVGNRTLLEAVGVGNLPLDSGLRACFG